MAEEIFEKLFPFVIDLLGLRRAYEAECFGRKYRLLIMQFAIVRLVRSWRDWFEFSICAAPPLVVDALPFLCKLGFS